MIARGLAIVAGALILATVAHVMVQYTGGYGSPHAYLTLAVAFGVACGSVFCGMAWTARAIPLAVAFAVCIVCGEAYNFLVSANRLMASTEAAQAPKREHAKAVIDAAARVEAAEKRAGTFTTSPRLTAAQEARKLADAAVVEKSAERGCRDNCRQLLQQAVDDAAQEVTKARAALEADRQAAEAEVRKLRTAHAAMAAPESPSPFADRIGMAPWLFDVIVAALGSIAINGLACCLMIFGSHTPHRAAPVSAKPYSVTDALASLKAAARSRVDLAQVHKLYVENCRTRGHTPADGDAFTEAVASYSKSQGIRLQMLDGRVFLCGVRLAS